MNPINHSKLSITPSDDEFAMAENVEATRRVAEFFESLLSPHRSINDEFVVAIEELNLEWKPGDVYRKPYEVHHLNNNPRDNSVENLIIRPNPRD